MPKIVENLREKIVEVTKKQILENGYSKVTMRSIAQACKIGLGTIYNYYESKDYIVATYMMDDWKLCLSNVQNEIINDKSIIESVYYGLYNFINEHEELFADKKAEISYASNVVKWHTLFRGQIAGIVFPICNGDGFLSEFIAEALISWAIEKKEFTLLEPILNKLIKKEKEIY